MLLLSFFCLFVLQGVLDGKYDDLSEQSFYMVGGIEEVIAKAEKIAKESATWAQSFTSSWCNNLNGCDGCSPASKKRRFIFFEVTNSQVLFLSIYVLWRVLCRFLREEQLYRAWALFGPIRMRTMDYFLACWLSSLSIICMNSQMFLPDNCFQLCNSGFFFFFPSEWLLHIQHSTILPFEVWHSWNPTTLLFDLLYMDLILLANY